MHISLSCISFEYTTLILKNWPLTLMVIVEIQNPSLFENPQKHIWTIFFYFHGNIVNKMLNIFNEVTVIHSFKQYICFKSNRVLKFLTDVTIHFFWKFKFLKMTWNFFTLCNTTPPFPNSFPLPPSLSLTLSLPSSTHHSL